MFKMKKLMAIVTATVMAASMTGIMASADENDVIIDDNVVESSYDINPLSSSTDIRFTWYANYSDSSSTFAVPTDSTGSISGTAGSSSSVASYLILQKKDANGNWVQKGTTYTVPKSGTTSIRFSFSNLSAGTYRFQVSSYDRDTASSGSLNATLTW